MEGDEVITQAPVVHNPFEDSEWSEQPIVQDQQQLVDPIVEGKEAIPPVEPAKEEIKTDLPTVDYNAYLKEQFGFDSVETAKEQIGKWKEAKPTEDFKFSNDESKLLFEAIKSGKKYEALTILAKQQALENLTSAELNERTASDIVKMAMMNKYPTLTKEQIDYRFSKQFSTPSEPVQHEDELDNDFEQRKSLWSQQVEDAKQELLIEAQISKPELEKLKSELSLQGILDKPEPEVAELTTEELAQISATKSSHIQQLNTALSSFKGVDLKVKNGEVELPVNYATSNEEKAELLSVISSAIENNDVNAFFGSRWFDKDGKPQNEQMLKDLNWMINGEKIAQKLANEAAAKRMEAKVKENLNLSLNNGPQGTFNPTAAERQKAMIDAIWDA